jgi:hypothetical protein
MSNKETLYRPGLSPSAQRQFEQQRQAIYQQIQELYSQWTMLTGERVPPFESGRSLPYLRSAWLGETTFFVCAGSSLEKLWEVSDAMAQATGFFQVSVVMYILMGTKPLLTPVTTRLQQTPNARLNIRRTHASIEINTPDVSYKEWRATHKFVRQNWGVENDRRFNEHDTQIQSIVDQLGGVPEGCGAKTEFWQQVRQERNKQENQKHEQAKQEGRTYTPRLHNRWESSRNAYKKCQDKLKKQMSLSPRYPTLSLKAVKVW